MKKEAEEGGYSFNPDRGFTMSLVGGLAKNEMRYGYQSCPCRLAEGNADVDRDIVCPCDYRDADLDQYGQCYCALYVTREFIEKKRRAKHIPERRKIEEVRARASAKKGPDLPASEEDIVVWRCSVCGYLCARRGPPEICPICKAKKDRFQRFNLLKGQGA